MLNVSDIERFLKAFCKDRTGKTQKLRPAKLETAKTRAWESSSHAQAHLQAIKLYWLHLSCNYACDRRVL